MKIALIGATGNVGSRLTSEALNRGHEVTAIARHANKLPPRARLIPHSCDVTDEGRMASLLARHEAVLSALKFAPADAQQLLRVVKASGVNRLLVVGGAGSLEVAPGIDLVDTPEFPAEYKSEALAGRDFLKVLRRESELNWTFLSPSALLVPGERTGRFRLGTDQLLVDEQGQSRISMEDFAIAMIDELETAKHPRQRFTVGY